MHEFLDIIASFSLFVQDGEEAEMRQRGDNFCDSALAKIFTAQTR